MLYRLTSGQAYFPIFQTQLNIIVAVSIPHAQKTPSHSVFTFSNGVVGNGILHLMRVGIFPLWTPGKEFRHLGFVGAW